MHRPEQGFYTKPVSVQHLYEVGHTYTEQGIRSRTPSYTEQGISSRTNNQYTGIVPTAIRSRAPLIAMSHFRQRWEIKAHLLKHETEPTINKALITMIITDPLGIAEFSTQYIVLAFFAQNSKLTLLKIVDFFYSVQRIFSKNIAIIRSSREGLQLYQKENPAHMFPCKYSKILQNRFFIKPLRWLLLHNQHNVLTLLKIVKFHYLAQVVMLAKYFVDQFLFYQIIYLLIDIFYLKLSLVSFDYSLRISVPYSECPTPYSYRDAPLRRVSIHEAEHTYKGQRILGKCEYPCLTPNALLRIAVRSARDTLLVLFWML